MPCCLSWTHLVGPQRSPEPNGRTSWWGIPSARWVRHQVESGVCAPAIPSRSPALVDADSLAYLALRRLVNGDAAEWELGGHRRLPTPPVVDVRAAASEGVGPAPAAGDVQQLDPADFRWQRRVNYQVLAQRFEA
jgi:hypothetical protein